MAKLVAFDNNIYPTSTTGSAGVLNLLIVASKVIDCVIRPTASLGTIFIA